MISCCLSVPLPHCADIEADAYVAGELFTDFVVPVQREVDTAIRKSVRCCLRGFLFCMGSFER